MWELGKCGQKDHQSQLKFDRKNRKDGREGNEWSKININLWNENEDERERKEEDIGRHCYNDKGAEEGISINCKWKVEEWEDGKGT